MFWDKKDALMMQRKQVNLQILEVLRDYICKHPEQRFGQAIRNIGIVDTLYNEEGMATYYTNIFNEEPEMTLKRIMEVLDEDGRV